MTARRGHSTSRFIPKRSFPKEDFAAYEGSRKNDRNDESPVPDAWTVNPHRTDDLYYNYYPKPILARHVSPGSQTRVSILEVPWSGCLSSLRSDKQFQLGVCTGMLQRTRTVLTAYYERNRHLKESFCYVICTDNYIEACYFAVALPDGTIEEKPP